MTEKQSIDVSKFTLIIGGAFWAVLAGLMGWTLASTISMRESQARVIEKLDNTQGNINTILLRQNRADDRLASIDTQIAVLKDQASRR